MNLFVSASYKIRIYAAFSRVILILLWNVIYAEV